MKFLKVASLALGLAASTAVAEDNNTSSDDTYSRLLAAEWENLMNEGNSISERIIAELQQATAIELQETTGSFARGDLISNFNFTEEDLEKYCQPLNERPNIGEFDNVGRALQTTLCAVSLSHAFEKLNDMGITIPQDLTNDFSQFRPKVDGLYGMMLGFGH